MGIILICGIVFIVCLIAAILVDKYGGYDSEGISTCCMAAATISMIIIICALFTRINLNNSFEKFKIDYANTVVLVESYQGGEYGNMPELTGKILDINATIAKHKSYVGNFWTGSWYSEEIGNLEPITFKKE